MCCLAQLPSDALNQALWNIHVPFELVRRTRARHGAPGELWRAWRLWAETTLGLRAAPSLEDGRRTATVTLQMSGHPPDLSARVIADALSAALHSRQKLF